MQNEGEIKIPSNLQVKNWSYDEEDEDDEKFEV